MSTRSKRKAKGDPPSPPPALPGLIDSHCHLDYPPASEALDEVLRQASATGIEALIHVGCDPSRFDPALALARDASEESPAVYVVLGVHPHAADQTNDEVMSRLEREWVRPEVVALGETGLDYFYDNAPRQAQRDSLAAHAELACRLGAPLVLHIRDAHDEALEILANHRGRPSAPGVVHCFTGTPEEARRWLDLGYDLSFSGISTFKNSEGLREAARLCPADRMHVETDAPFLAPVPVRGRPNRPANVAFTCAALAAERGVSAAALAAQCAQNTRTLFGLPGA